MSEILNTEEKQPNIKVEELDHDKGIIQDVENFGGELLEEKMNVEQENDVKVIDNNDEVVTESIDVDHSTKTKKKFYDNDQTKKPDQVALTNEEKRNIDMRSVYIGNVDYETTPLELQQHFSNAGVVNRVTILMNKFTGQPKGFAYMEFADVESMKNAVLTLDGSNFKDRVLKVFPKRTNIPGISSTNRSNHYRGDHLKNTYRGRGLGGRLSGNYFLKKNRFSPY